MMRILLLGMLAALLGASGCATSGGPEHDAAAAAPASATPPAALPATPEPRSRTFRLGFWEIDLAAVDREPRGTTFRLLDIRIFKLLEVGSGPEYHAFSLVESPHLFHLLASRGEGVTRELRVVDLEAFDAAVVRHRRESARTTQTHVLRLPVVGSVYGREVDGSTEDQTVLYVLRREVER